MRKAKLKTSHTKAMIRKITEWYVILIISIIMFKERHTLKFSYMSIPSFYSTTT